NRVRRSDFGRRRTRLKLWQGHALLPHIFSCPISIARLAWLIALEEQKLARALICINLVRKRRGVRKFERHMALPAGLERGHVHDDSAARVSRFAEANDKNVAGNAEILDRAGEGKTVWRDDAHVGFAVYETVRCKILGVDDGAVDIREDLEFGRDARVIAVGREPVADATVAALRLDERLDHALRPGGFANPFVGKYGHVFSCRYGARCASGQSGMRP